MIEKMYEKLEVWFTSEHYREKVELEKKMRVELEKFVKRFNVSMLKEMPIEEYVTGLNNPDSFCNMIENTFRCFGNISGRTSAFQKYVIYWNKDANDYLFGDSRTKSRKGFGSTKEEIYENVKKAIINIIEAAQVSNYNKIAENPLNPQFKNKIAFLYAPETQLPIYSDDDLIKLLTIFDIPFNPKEDRAFKREKLYHFYLEHIAHKGLSTDMFMNFVYSFYGYRSILRTNEKPTIEKNDISEYVIQDVLIDTPFTTKRTGNGTKNRVVYNAGSEEVKLLTGKKAENIVIEYLNMHKKELKIKKINLWCQGKSRDDGRGYDISYIQEDGTEIYIEVKSTKSDIENKVFFEMSANEYSVMRAHEDNYYIYFVNDVNKGKIIKRILGKDIFNEAIEPVKYRINFESKLKKENEIN